MATVVSADRMKAHADEHNTQEGLNLWRRSLRRGLVILLLLISWPGSIGGEPLVDDEAALSGALDLARLGEYARATAQLTSLIEAGGLDPEKSKALRARARLARGEIAMIERDSSHVRPDLDAALQLASQAGRGDLEALVLSAMARLHRLEGETREAAEAARRARLKADAAGDPATSIRIQVNAAREAWRAGDRAKAQAESRAASQLMTAFPDRADTLDQLHLAETWAAMSREEGDLVRSANFRLAAFERFRSVAKRPQEALSQATLARTQLGIGQLYRDEERFEEAARAVERAALLAQRVGAYEVLQRSEHELGRLRLSMGDYVAAEAAYERSLDLLERLRPQMQQSFAFEDRSFRDGRGAVYYELVALLLREETGMVSGQSGRDRLRGRNLRAREIVERLKADEIRDYYGDACSDLLLGPLRSIDDVPDEGALIVYPIVLADRIELLVTHNGRIERFRVPVSRERVTRTTRQFRRALEDAPSRAYLRPAKELHDWLVSPYAALLDESIRTIVFVPDAPFRTIPLAALHDGETFLIERFATATTPGVSVVDPRPVDLKALRVLAVGISDPVDGLPRLAHVPAELSRVRAQLGAKVMLDDAFTRETLARELAEEPWSIVHVATHAEFGDDDQQSYLMTHDGRLGMNQFDDLISGFEFREQPLELLTLSACETAAGSDRAALGLAGAAVRSGARSVLGTLWTVNDAATARLIDSFYARLVRPGTSRAEAIRGAQRLLLEDESFRHPAFWSPFLLINNWM